MTNGPYTKPGRLADVLGLIQVLALDKATYRSEDGVAAKEFVGSPCSAKSWTLLAEDHPEFFRVKTSSEHPISLLARHVQPRDELNKTRQPLTSEFTQVLLRTAIDLHDRQVDAAERWMHLWPPLITGLLVMASAAISVLLTAHVTRPAQTGRFVSTEGFGAGVLLDTTKGQLCWAGLEPKARVSLPGCNALR